MTTKKLSLLFLSLMIIPFFFTSCTSNGGTQGAGTQDGGTQGGGKEVSTPDGGAKVVIKDCCMMKDGKMVMQKDGKITPMETAMTMENGTVCDINGECTTKEGKKMMMKEGDCMEMSGKTFNEKVIVAPKEDNAMAYSCPMHPEMKSDKPAKCPKCSMDMVKK